MPQPHAANAGGMPVPTVGPPIRFDHTGDHAGFVNHSHHRVMYKNKIPDGAALARGDQVSPAGLTGYDTDVQRGERHVPAHSGFAGTRSVGLRTGVFENGVWGSSLPFLRFLMRFGT